MVFERETAGAGLLVFGLLLLVPEMGRGTRLAWMGGDKGCLKGEGRERR